MAPVTNLPEGILFTRVFLSVFLAAALGVSGWMAVNLQTLGNRVASLEERIVNQGRIQALEVKVAQQDLMQQIIVASSQAADNEEGIAQIREWLKQVWPRLRAHGENVAILKREIERSHAVSIELKEPDAQ